jgi:GT2 family glycosyltransferase
MSISVIVPVWNGRDLLESLLDSIDRQTAPAAEVIVVDNGSTDGAPELARCRGAQVESMGRNAGFAAAVNRGIELARSEWIAVLNSDVVLAPDYFEKLSLAGAWFASGKILDARRNGLLDAAFDLTCRGGATWRAGNGRPDAVPFSEPRHIHSVPWTAALFRADLFRNVGMLETRFESYLEDVDFGLRCAAQGILGIYIPDAVAWHRGSATLGRWHSDTVRRIARNQILIIARHYSRRTLARCWWHIAVAQSLWGLVALRHGAGFAWARGILQGLSAFSDIRRTFANLDAGLPGRLQRNDHHIWELQRATGFDLYWRLYFLLTGGEAK